MSSSLGVATGGADQAAPPVAKASSAGRDVLVVGSYPPVPTAGATVAVDTVRRLWADGARPHVASGRASAAPLTVAVTGLRAGRRLNRLREVTGAVDVVLCVERDVPIPTGGFAPGVLPVVQRLTAKRVCQALGAFDHVTLVACGDHGVPASVWSQLVFAADTVIDRSDLDSTPGVTTLGPPSAPGSALALRAERLATRVLGRRAPRVREIVGRGRRRVRGVARRGPWASRPRSGAAPDQPRGATPS